MRSLPVYMTLLVLSTFVQIPAQAQEEFSLTNCYEDLSQVILLKNKKQKADEMMEKLQSRSTPQIYMDLMDQRIDIANDQYEVAVQQASLSCENLDQKLLLGN